MPDLLTESEFGDVVRHSSPPGHSLTRWPRCTHYKVTCPPPLPRVTKMTRRLVVAIVACCVLVVAGVALPYLVGNRDGSWADEHKTFRDPCVPALKPVEKAGFTHQDAAPHTEELPDHTKMVCDGSVTTPSSEGGGCA